ncbi:transposase family protein [Mycobacterium kansasii]|uniref:Transposase family protein n=1 Tax=Mycobacterium kansasii TaxID=1768 RepID=A0A1V3X4M0_MYCKA|nr:transposase family protein [Mycobacterium kansasii]OOK76939.1 transposase family protein [Mycobacterium kansasii]
MTPMLTDKVDFVIGVDTHRDSHTAAIVTAAGGLVERLTVATDAFGFRKLDTFAAKHATGRRVWAIEGTGSFGAGLTTHLLGRGEWVVEIDRPARPARRDGAKSDDLDAVRAAREALTREHLAAPALAATGKLCECYSPRVRVQSWPVPKLLGNSRP